MRPRLPVMTVVLVATLAAGRARADDPMEARARKLHAGAIVVDTHIDAPDQLADKWADVSQRGATTQFDLPRAREGGLTAAFFSIYVSAEHASAGTAGGRALELIDVTRRVVAENPRATSLATTAGEIRAAKRQKKLAILMGLEGGHALEGSIGAMRELHRAGVRYVTLTHSNTNTWADSSGPFWLPDYDPKAQATHGGLNDLGRKMITAMNEVGMIVDVSHVSDDTIADVLEVSTAPIMASHSSCRALADMPRNLTDDQIRAIAKKGGVVMINFGSSFLDPSSYRALRQALDKVKPEYLKLKARLANDPIALGAETRKLLQAAAPPPTRTTVARLVDHLEHVMQVGGPGAAGLGSDFDGVTDLPVGMDDVSFLPAITLELVKRGHDDATIRGVLGENFLRFFERVEAVAKSRPRSTAPATRAPTE